MLDKQHFKILLVDDNRGRSALLRRALSDCGHEVIATLQSGANISRYVAELQPDVIFVDLESPDRDTLEHMHTISRDNPKPVLMFSEDDDSGRIHQAIEAGVSAYIVDAFSGKRIKPLIDVAIARFREYQALRDELAKTKDTLEERKHIDKAKGLLMKRHGMSEDEAHKALRKLAMDQGKKLGEAAHNVISIMELLGK